MSDATTPLAGEGKPLPPRGPRPWVMVLVGLVIVVSGAVIGAGVTVLALKNRLAAPPTPGERTAALIASDLRNRYNLTDEQAKQVKEIMARRMEVIEAIRRQAHEQMAAEHETLRAEMKAVLTPEQFEQWLAQFESLRPPPFGPPGGPGRAGGPRDGLGPRPGRGPGPGRPPPPREDSPSGRPLPRPGAPPGPEGAPSGPPGQPR